MNEAITDVLTNQVYYRLQLSTLNSDLEGHWKVIGRSSGHLTEMSPLSEVDAVQQESPPSLALRATSWVSEFCVIDDARRCEDTYQVHQFPVIINSDLRLDKMDF